MRVYGYTLARVLSPDLFAVDGLWGPQIWTRAKLRKARQCCICSQAVKAGAEAFRPLTNQENRYHRAHEECLKLA